MKNFNNKVVVITGAASEKPAKDCLRAQIVHHLAGGSFIAFEFGL